MLFSNTGAKNLLVNVSVLLVRFGWAVAGRIHGVPLDHMQMGGSDH